MSERKISHDAVDVSRYLEHVHTSHDTDVDLSAFSSDALFDVRDTEPKRCRLKRCGTHRKNLCIHDFECRDLPPAERPRRPRGCIAGPQPATDPIPF